MVRKQDRVWKMCVDYRCLNAVTKFDCFPFPRLDKNLDAFSGAVLFSSLDLAITYYQVPVFSSEVEKTAFVTHVGLFDRLKCPSVFATRCRVDVRTLDVCRVAKTHLPYLPRLSRRCYRAFEASL